MSSSLDVVKVVRVNFLSLEPHRGRTSSSILVWLKAKSIVERCRSGPSLVLRICACPKRELYAMRLGRKEGGVEHARTTCYTFDAACKPVYQLIAPTAVNGGDN